MKSDFHIHIRGALRVEYRVQTRPLSEETALISSEQRFAGGSGAVPALALAHLGARVRLSGNPIGTDSHGGFLLAQLQHPNLELVIEARGDVTTPYAILTRDQGGIVQTLLSPDAAQLEGPQNYPALLKALREALTMWNQPSAENSSVEELMRAYDESFGDLTRWKNEVRIS